MISGPRRLGCRAAASLLVLALGVAVPAAPAAAQDGRWWHPAWRMPEVWQITDGAGVTVAVVDSGVDASVSDLAGAVMPGIDLTGGGTDGRVDTSQTGHGTGMASLIASRGTVSGVVGVAPGASILPINVGSSPIRTNESSLQDYPDAIRHAADQGASVVNFSQAAYALGPEPCPEPVAEAVRYALSRDVIVVAATANDIGEPSSFPESCPGVLTVGTVGTDLQSVPGSGGTGYVDVAAPGNGISAVIPGGTVVEVDGTSNSTALVSGVVALLRAEFPEESASQLVARILATVEDVAPAGHDAATGYGMVRPYEALTASVPANAPNPVFDAVVEPEPTEAPAGEAFVPNQPPRVAPDPRPDGPAFNLLFVLLVALLLGAGLLVIGLVRRPRRSGNPPPPPPPSSWPGGG